mmetsp:Transcript_1085/g.2989  ORF Transcript_1085/g.2989 Transcript_1085/m.2989 type:complete len:207 (-) Transcript_1085:1345-1965(-)
MVAVREEHVEAAQRLREPEPRGAGREPRRDAAGAAHERRGRGRGAGDDGHGIPALGHVRHRRPLDDGGRRGDWLRVLRRRGRAPGLEPERVRDGEPGERRVRGGVPGVPILRRPRRPHGAAEGLHDQQRHGAVLRRAHAARYEPRRAHSAAVLRGLRRRRHRHSLRPLHGAPRGRRARAHAHVLYDVVARGLHLRVRLRLGHPAQR